MYLPGYLCANEKFRARYCLTMMDMANTTFAYPRVSRRLNEWADEQKAQIIATKRRFGDPDYDADAFDADVSAVDAFFAARRRYVERYLKADLGLSGEVVPVTLHMNDISAGKLFINTAELKAASSWTGSYFTDFPVTITAEPADGYRFIGWSDGVTDVTREIELEEGGLELTAEFVSAVSD